jgi:hypothetical protein
MVETALAEHADSLERLAVCDNTDPEMLSEVEREGRACLGTLRGLGRVRSMTVNLDFFGGVELSPNDESIVLGTTPARLAEVLPLGLSELKLTTRNKTIYPSGLFSTYEEYALDALDELLRELDSLPRLKLIVFGSDLTHGRCVENRHGSGQRRIKHVPDGIWTHQWGDSAWQRLLCVQERFKDKAVELRWAGPGDENGLALHVKDRGPADAGGWPSDS